jgi:hypothetical protein
VGKGSLSATSLHTCQAAAQLGGVRAWDSSTSDEPKVRRCRCADVLPFIMSLDRGLYMLGAHAVYLRQSVVQLLQSAAGTVPHRAVAVSTSQCHAAVARHCKNSVAVL